MHKILRTLALIVAALMVVYASGNMIGCGDDDDDTVDEVAAALVSTAPASGGEIAANGVLTITFDNPPGDVTVNGTPATVAGKTATWNATGLTAGSTANLAVAWTIAGGGSSTVSLTVRDEDTIAPTVTGGDVGDGDKDVDSDALNAAGTITIEFSEVVTGTLRLQAGGADVGHLSKNDGTKVVLEAVAGKELAKETEYQITGTVRDAAGNTTAVDITFVTKAKEE
jgi:hypothetical protein